MGHCVSRCCSPRSSCQNESQPFYSPSLSPLIESHSKSTLIQPLDDEQKEAAWKAYKALLSCKLQDVELKFENNCCLSENVEKFDVLGFLSEGMFGKVVLVQHASNGTKYAMKIRNKKSMAEMKMIPYVIREKMLLSAFDSEFIIKLLFTAKDSTNIYLVVEFAPFGDFYRCIVSNKRISEARARLYTAQIVLALEYLHCASILYRDLKPENILVFEDGYLKLGDFAFAKRVVSYTHTFCGTLDYLAPELILGMPYRGGVDWWALGVLLYEMLHHQAPFSSFFSLPEDVEYNIVTQPVRFHYGIGLSEEVEDLVSRLLEKKPSRRLGTLLNGADEVKRHTWFKEINFNDVFMKRYKLETRFEVKLPKPVDRDKIFGKETQDIYTGKFVDF